MEVLSANAWSTPASLDRTDTSPASGHGSLGSSSERQLRFRRGAATFGSSGSTATLPRVTSLDLYSDSMSGLGQHYPSSSYDPMQGGSERSSYGSHREDAGPMHHSLDPHGHHVRAPYGHPHDPMGAPQVAPGYSSAHVAQQSAPPRNNQAQEQPEQRTPRPSNAWILYRSQKFRELQQNKDPQARSASTGKSKSQAEISRIISAMWQNETAAVRRQFEALADEKKLEHQRMYPTYRYRPRKRNKDANNNRSTQSSGSGTSTVSQVNIHQGSVASQSSAGPMDGAHRQSAHPHLYSPYDLSARDAFARQGQQGFRRPDSMGFAQDGGPSYWDKRKAAADDMARRSGLHSFAQTEFGSDLGVGVGGSSGSAFSSPSMLAQHSGRLQGSSHLIGSTLPSGYLRAPNPDGASSSSGPIGHYGYLQGGAGSGGAASTQTGMVGWQGEVSSAGDAHSEFQTPSSQYTSASDSDSARARPGMLPRLDDPRASPSMHLAGMPGNGSGGGANGRFSGSFVGQSDGSLHMHHGQHAQQLHHSPLGQQSSPTEQHQQQPRGSSSSGRRQLGHQDGQQQQQPQQNASQPFRYNASPSLGQLFHPLHSDFGGSSNPGSATGASSSALPQQSHDSGILGRSEDMKGFQQDSSTSSDPSQGRRPVYFNSNQ